MESESPPRPVKGEILGVPARPNGALRRTGDAIDVSFETVPQGTRPGAITGSAAPFDGGMQVLKGAQDISMGPQRAGPAFWTSGLLLVAAAFWFSGGHALFHIDRSGQLVAETAGFEVLGVDTRLERFNGRVMLLVDGAVQNTGMRDAVAPGVVVNVEADNGAVTRYALGLGERLVAPGDTASFSSRLAPPSGGLRRVFVTVGEAE